MSGLGRTDAEALVRAVPRTCGQVNATANACPQDLNAIILQNPLEGQVQPYTCPTCGVQASYTCPLDARTAAAPKTPSAQVA